ncbi:hypothetical protein KKI24_05970 [bacterium]|nr:hypothetical protein [bacterium]
MVRIPICQVGSRLLSARCRTLGLFIENKGPDGNAATVKKGAASHSTAEKSTDLDKKRWAPYGDFGQKGGMMNNR